MYQLSFGTFWVWVEEKPSIARRIYCFTAGTIVTLSPIILFLIIIVVPALLLKE